MIKPFDPHQREELIEDLLALKDAVLLEKSGFPEEKDFA